MGGSVSRITSEAAKIYGQPRIEEVEVVPGSGKTSKFYTLPLVRDLGRVKVPEWPENKTVAASLHEAPDDRQRQEPNAGGRMVGDQQIDPVAERRDGLFLAVRRAGRSLTADSTGFCASA